MTICVQVVKRGDTFQENQWHPWRNCTSLQETAQLAANKFMRESGNMRSATEPRITLDVYCWEDTDETPRHKNGNPKQCTVITLDYVKNEAA